MLQRAPRGGLVWEGGPESTGRTSRGAEGPHRGTCGAEREARPPAAARSRMRMGQAQQVQALRAKPLLPHQAPARRNHSSSRASAFSPGAARQRLPDCSPGSGPRPEIRCHHRGPSSPDSSPPGGYVTVPQREGTCFHLSPGFICTLLAKGGNPPASPPAPPARSITGGRVGAGPAPGQLPSSLTLGNAPPSSPQGEGKENLSRWQSGAPRPASAPTSPSAAAPAPPHGAGPRSTTRLAEGGRREIGNVGDAALSSQQHGGGRGWLPSPTRPLGVHPLPASGHGRADGASPAARPAVPGTRSQEESKGCAALPGEPRQSRPAPPRPRGTRRATAPKSGAGLNRRFLYKVPSRSCFIKCAGTPAWEKKKKKTVSPREGGWQSSGFLRVTSG